MVGTIRIEITIVINVLTVLCATIGLLSLRSSLSPTLSLSLPRLLCIKSVYAIPETKSKGEELESEWQARR